MVVVTMMVVVRLGGVFLFDVSHKPLLIVMSGVSLWRLLLWQQETHTNRLQVLEIIQMKSAPLLLIIIIPLGSSAEVVLEGDIEVEIMLLEGDIEGDIEEREIMLREGEIMLGGSILMDSRPLSHPLQLTKVFICIACMQV